MNSLAPAIENGLRIFDEDSNRSLMKSLKTYSWAATELGYRHSLWSERSLQQLSIMAFEKKNQITHNLNLAAMWIDECISEGGTFSDARYLEKALQHYGLSLDPRLRSTIHQDTVVEIYSENMLQLYRSFKMLDLTGYSLLDLCTFEWYVLWERPQLTIEQMHSEARKVLQSEIPFKEATVSSHVLKESFDTGLTEPFSPRNALVQFQYMGFLKGKTAESPRAFASTAIGKVLSENPREVQQIAFL